MKLRSSLALLSLVSTFFISCKQQNTETTSQNEFKINYETYTLDNGLKVIFHVDKSDPVVAVTLTSHVGSAREISGRTGFAHLFEHLLFLESENLGKGGLDKMSARIGGSGANGSTSRDITNYFQTVPKDALEKMIWAEADKLGFFINTVTEPVLAKEKQVVKNEKRQSVDNRPYGHNFHAMHKNLYPENHPYHWEVIGSLEDLQNATLQDVKDFYNRWYVPNNVILTIAGDFDTEQAKKWIEKYFGEIKRGADIPEIQKQAVALEASKKIYYEDNFARIPQLSLVWPTVYQYHKDYYALEVLSTYLVDGKEAPLYKTLVDSLKLTDRVGAYNYNSEIAGEFIMQVRPFGSMDLDTVYQGITEGLGIFEKEGISQAALDRIKAEQETDFYNGLSSVLGKGFQLAQYEIFAKDAGYINEDIKNILAVTPEDVMQVYKTYIKDKPFIASSFVPKGEVSLALENSVAADIKEEQIIEGAEETFDASIAAEYEKTPSSFDRSVEPPYGESPDIILPEIWKDNLSSGIEVFGIENKEVPLVQLQLDIKGGMLLEDANKIGVSNMLSSLITKGTANKTPEQLENAIKDLGASINVYSGQENITFSINTLAKNYLKTMALLEEIILEPRWDASEFDLIKQSVLNQLEQQKADPQSIASIAFYKLIYGEDHLLSHDITGTPESVANITLEDLKHYYQNYFSPSLTQVKVVGDIASSKVVKSLKGLNEKWVAKEVHFPELATPKAPETAKIYFYDVPGAKQSVVRIGYPVFTATDKDYYPATLVNYRLGGGGFASQLTQELRENKGYTYGIFSNFYGTNYKGPFQIGSNIRSNVTYDAMELIKGILENYGTNYNEEDLEVTKGYMLKSGARANETLRNKLGMLTNIAAYGYPEDYPKQRELLVKNITVEDMKQLANEYLNADKMIYLIVGDAATQLQKLEDLGIGKPILLNQ